MILDIVNGEVVLDYYHMMNWLKVMGVLISDCPTYIVSVIWIFDSGGLSETKEDTSLTNAELVDILAYNILYKKVKDICKF